MIREEVVKIIRIICDSYPNYKPHNISETVDVWTMMLSEFSYEQISVALKAYILSDTSGFAPSIGQLIGKLRVATEADDAGALSAWAMVSKALRNGYYGAEEEFEKLPPLVQKAVGSPMNLRNWSQSDLKSIETVVMSQFLTAFKTEKRRQEELAFIPNNIMLQMREHKLLEG